MKKIVCITLVFILLIANVVSVSAYSGSVTITQGEDAEYDGMRITKVGHVTIFSEEATVTELGIEGWTAVHSSFPLQIAANDHHDGWYNYAAMLYSDFDAEKGNISEAEYVGMSFSLSSPITIDKPGTYLINNFLQNIVHADPLGQNYIILFVGDVDTSINLEAIEKNNPLAKKTVSEVGPGGLLTYVPGVSLVDGPDGVGVVTPPVDTNEYELKAFSDVTEKHWAFNEVMLCAKNGAVNGTTKPDKNGYATFTPAGDVTLGQFLAVITRLVCPEDIVETSGHWALCNYNAALKSGIIKDGDFGNTSADLNKPITRENMAYILVNAAGVRGETLNILENAKNAVTDYESISEDRTDAVLRCYSNGLITGFSDRSFAPADTMTRAQMAVVVCRLMEYAPRAEVSIN